MTSNINMNIRPRHDNTLHTAAKLKNYNEVEEVIRNYPSLAYEQNSNGDTPLHLASRVGCLEIVKLLTKTHEDVEASSDHNDRLLMATNDRTETALHDATRNGHFDIVKLLMEVQPNLVSIENALGESPVYLAVDRKYVHVATYILRHATAECSIKGRNGQNALHAAVIRMQIVHPVVKKHYLVWKLYFKHKVLDSTKELRNLLGDVCRPATEFIADVLEKYPLAMTEADKHGWIPLHYAAKLGMYDVVDLLVKRDKSVVSVRNNDGMCAVHIAARQGWVRVVERLASECKDSSELLDMYHRTPLHSAVESGDSSVVHDLIMIDRFEYLLNEQDIAGNTALMVAAIHRHENIVELLVKERRIDKAAENNEGLTAADIIQSHPEVIFPSKASIMKLLEGTSSGLGLTKDVDTEDCTKQSDETMNNIVERKKKRSSG